MLMFICLVSPIETSFISNQPMALLTVETGTIVEPDMSDWALNFPLKEFSLNETRDSPEFFPFFKF